MPKPTLLILNQMATPLTWEFAEDWARDVGPVALLTGCPHASRAGCGNGINVASAPAYVRGRLFAGTLSWLAYVLRALRWIWRFPSATPVLLFTSPPILPWIGWILHRLRGQPYAVVVHDIYPDVLVRLGRLPEHGIIARAWRQLNQVAYEEAQLVITLGARMAKLLRSTFDPAKTRSGAIAIAPPWADTSAIRPLPKSENWFAIEHQQIGKTTVMYSGNIGFSHDVETLLGAAGEMRKDSRFHFIVIGSGPKWELVPAAVRERELTNVTVLPWQTEEAFPYSIASADIALIPLDSRVAGMSLPSRAYSFMAAGVPLLVSSARGGDLSDLLSTFAIGWEVAPDDPQAIARLLASLSPEELTQRKTESRRAAECIGSRQNSVAMVKLLADAFHLESR